MPHGYTDSEWAKLGITDAKDIPAAQASLNGSKEAKPAKAVVAKTVVEAKSSKVKGKKK